MLGDAVAGGAMLWISCEARGCGHAVRLAPAELAALCGYDKPLTAIPFRCTRCGSRDAAVRVDVSRPEAPAAFSYPDWWRST